MAAFKVMDYPPEGTGSSGSGGPVTKPLPDGSKVSVRLVEIEQTPIKGRNNPESRIIGDEAVDFLRDAYQESAKSGDTAYNMYIKLRVVEPPHIEGQAAEGHEIKLWYTYTHRFPSKIRGGRGAIAAMLRAMGFFGEVERFAPPFTNQLVGLVGECVTSISEGTDGYPDRTSVRHWVDKPKTDSPVATATPADVFDDEDIPF